VGRLGAVAPAASAAKYVGGVYTETNGTPNKVVVFGRKPSGELVQLQSVKTGGDGGHQAQPGCTPPPGCPILDANSEVDVSPNGRLVFAVNAGSNTVTSFRQTFRGLKRVSVESSGGTFPTSVTSAGNLGTLTLIGATPSTLAVRDGIDGRSGAGNKRARDRRSSR
jgi:6-phosphogluconolactonase